MGAATAVLARAPVQPFPALNYVSVSGRVSKLSWIAGGSFLLLAWLILIVICTIRLYRPTFGKSLDLYVAARMLAHRRELVDDRTWDMAENKRLSVPFEPSFRHTDSESGSKHNSAAMMPTVPTQSYNHGL